MSIQEKIIQQYYDYFNKGDMENFFSLLHHDIIHDVNQGEKQIGKDKFIAFMNRMNHCYKEQITDLVILTDSTKNRAASEYIVHGVYFATDTGLPPAHGQKYSLPGGAFFEIKDNLIYRVTNYYNLNTWLEQVAGS